jgi:hypothetical protein
MIFKRPDGTIAITIPKRRWTRKGIDYRRYKEWRLACLIRDNFCCQLCGEKGVKLEVHHIIPWRKNQNLRYKNSNGLTVCATCHDKIDPWAAALRAPITSKRPQLSERQTQDHAQRDPAPTKVIHDVEPKRSLNGPQGRQIEPASELAGETGRRPCPHPDLSRATDRERLHEKPT